MPMAAHVIMVKVSHTGNGRRWAAIEVRGVVPAGRSRSSRQMANTVASPQKGRAACHDVAAGTTVLITQLPLPLERS
jgi:hypothetical protein